MTDMATATPRLRRSTSPGSRTTAIVSSVVGALAVNLLIYIAGRASGAKFTYTSNRQPNHVDALAVAFMTVVPAAIGLTLVAWLSPRWPVLIRIARIVVATVAIATIGLLTLPAGFDTASTLLLSAMHLALIPPIMLALTTLTPRNARAVTVGS